MNRQFREQERGPQATPEDLARYAKAGLPKPLSPSELDPLSGAVNWPALLKEAPYASDRKTVDYLFTLRAQSGQLTFEQQTQLTQAMQNLEDTLKQNINSYSPQVYVSAKKFVQQLAFSVRTPTA